MNPAPRDARYSEYLRTWRRKRRLSQLELALESGVSQRHVSFLESSRARPSRAMVLQLSEALGVPIRDRNDWLTAAGFAPLFRRSSFQDPAMQQVMAAVRMMLANHDPFPAIAMDRAWNVVLANDSFEKLNQALGAHRWQRAEGEPRNLMRLFFHPGGIRPLVPNWEQVAPLLWFRARREAEAWGGEEMRHLIEELLPYWNEASHALPEDSALFPVLTVDFLLGDARLSLFTVISTFGTAQDVTTDDLRMEMFFPANEVTERAFRALAVTETPSS